jgi:two-component system, OmpR family, phosphate regulon sensor histidine kinase PhoR
LKVGLRAKLFILSLCLMAGVGLVTALFFEWRMRRDLDHRAEQDLLQRARAAGAAAARIGGEGVAQHDALADELARHTNVTVAILAADGRVLGDSQRSVAELEAGVAPPLDGEVRAALADGSGVSRRLSPGEGTLVAAAAFPLGETPPRGVVRLGLPLAGEETGVGDLRTLLFLAGLVGLLVAVLIGGVASELMARTMRKMVDAAVEEATGEAPDDPDDPQSQNPPPSKSFDRIAEDLHAAVHELAEERDRLETILECMHDAVLALDAQGRVTITNTAANRLLAMDDDDVGRPLLEAVRAPALAELAERCGDGGEAITDEFEMDAPKYRHVLAHAAPLRTEGGVVIVMHDVTQLRQLERVRRDFVANVSHELRTPVSVIRANAETLLESALADTARAPRFVEGIHRSAERLSNLISDLLDLSRIEAGQYATEIVEVPVRPAVDAVVDGLIARANARHIDVKNEVDSTEAALADSTGLSQILQNLLDNAIKYAPEAGHVWVRAVRHDDRLRIEVEDDGPGIEPHQRERVFERFYRIDPGRSRELGGTGLGLSIVKHLAEQMGGKVGVEAAPKRGSLFWIDLPAAA